MLSNRICCGLIQYPQGYKQEREKMANFPLWSCWRPQHGTVIFRAVASGLSPASHSLTLICCTAVPSRHPSSVTVQMSRASKEGSHSDNCNTYLTLTFRERLGIGQGRERRLISIPKLNAQQLAWEKWIAENGPGLIENFPKVTFDRALFIIFFLAKGPALYHAPIKQSHKMDFWTRCVVCL